ncbi:tail assembly protein [Geobacillus phage GR1]|nr:tail assembly protein [Geobacillus phage GR1]
MKASEIIRTEKNSYRFKIKYSTLCDLREMGVDLMSEKGSKELQNDPTKFRLVFWKGLEAGEMRKFEKEEAFDIFDEVMEEVGPEEFAQIIPKALAIKTKPSKN